MAFEHLQGLVPGNGRDLHGVQTLFEQPAGGFMPQVVEAKIFDPALHDRPDGEADHRQQPLLPVANQAAVHGLRRCRQSGLGNGVSMWHGKPPYLHPGAAVTIRMTENRAS